MAARRSIGSQRSAGAPATDEGVILAQNVRRLRLARGLSQEELAEAAEGLRQAAISEIETARGNPTFETLKSIAAALDVTISELFKLPLLRMTIAFLASFYTF